MCEVSSSTDWSLPSNSHRRRCFDRVLARRRVSWIDLAMAEIGRLSGGLAGPVAPHDRQMSLNGSGLIAV
jgi:hypothetical protein